MTLTEFLLARIAEDEAFWKAMPFGPTFGHAEMWGRMVADCEAKRKIVEDYADSERAVKGYDHDAPTDAYWQEWGNRHALRLAAERLAAIYADHSDYDEGWRS